MDSLKNADGNYPVVTVEMGGRVVRGDLVYLSFDSAAVRQTEPRPGGCVRMKIHPPYTDGYIVDDEGYINEYGTQFVAKILVELDEAAVAMEQRLPAIRSALQQVRSAGESLPLTQQAVRAHELLGGAELPIDLPLFTSTLEEWIRTGEFGLAGS
jgi:hypothetical protein